MTDITVHAPNGVTLHFPAGTPQSVITQQMQRLGSPTPDPMQRLTAPAFPAQTQRPYVMPQPPVTAYGVTLHSQPPAMTDPTPGPVGGSHGSYDPRMGSQSSQVTPAQYAEAGAAVPGQLASFAQGASFNLGDEIAGVAGGLGNMIGGQDHRFSTGYNANRDSYNNQIDIARQLDPTTTDFMQLMGGAATGLGLQKSGLSLVARARPNVPSVLGRSAVEGGAYGALAGAGSGDSLEERINNALAGVGVGAATGGAVGALAGPAASRMARNNTAASSDIEAEALSRFAAAKAAGTGFDGQYIGQGLNQIIDAAQRAGASPALRSSWDLIEHVIAGNPGNVTTLEGLESLRRMIGAAQANAGDAAQGDMTVLTAMKRTLDDIVNNPSAPIIAGDAAGLQQMQEARQLWGQMSRVQDIETAIERAKNAPLGTQRTAVRNEFRPLINDPMFMEGLTPEQQQAMRDVVRGTFEEKTLRGLSNLAGGTSLGTLAGLIGYQTTGSLTAGGLAGAATLGALGATSGALRGGANSILNSNAEIVRQLLAGGGAPIRLNPVMQQALAAALAGNSAVYPSTFRDMVQ